MPPDPLPRDTESQPPIRGNPPIQICKENPAQSRESSKTEYLAQPNHPSQSKACAFFTGNYLASRDPRVPWYAKALAVAVAAYALSPIDLIPDFIPVLGYLDDLILLPLGILLVVWLIPPEIMAEHRELAAASQEHPVSRTAAAIIVCIWIASVGLAGWLAYRYFAR